MTVTFKHAYPDRMLKPRSDSMLESAGERIGKLVRNAEKAKTPVMCVVGEKEASSGQLSVRTYGEDGDRGVMTVSEVINRIRDADKIRVPFGHVLLLADCIVIALVL